MSEQITKSAWMKKMKNESYDRKKNYKNCETITGEFEKKEEESVIYSTNDFGILLYMYWGLFSSSLNFR